jgi:hypothetical protein
MAARAYAKIADRLGDRHLFEKTIAQEGIVMLAGVNNLFRQRAFAVRCIPVSNGTADYRSLDELRPGANNRHDLQS